MINIFPNLYIRADCEKHCHVTQFSLTLIIQLLLLEMVRDKCRIRGLTCHTGEPQLTDIHRLHDDSYLHMPQL